MTQKKRKCLHILFKMLGLLVSCGMPFYAICEHFPIWTTEFGSARSLGSGAIISSIVLLVIFRSTVFSWIKEKLQGKHAPPMVFWIVALIICYILVYINKFLIDLTVILWMGLVGCTIGNIFNLIADHKFGEVESNDGRA